MATDTRTLYRRWCESFREEPNGCWTWTGAFVRNGYGKMHFRVAGVDHYRYAHRYGYELLVGPIPDGLDLDHLCRNRGCVNPRHLEPVTRAENLRRSPLVRAHWERLPSLAAAARRNTRAAA